MRYFPKIRKEFRESFLIFGIKYTYYGKTSKITWRDFTQAMTGSGVPEKVQETMRSQFVKVQTKWEETIRSSFLSEEMQDRYLMIINERLGRLSI